MELVRVPCRVASTSASIPGCAQTHPVLCCSADILSGIDALGMVTDQQWGVLAVALIDVLYKLSVAR
jgi:hypothetical protein